MYVYIFIIRIKECIHVKEAAAEFKRFQKLAEEVSVLIR